MKKKSNINHILRLETHVIFLVCCSVAVGKRAGAVKIQAKGMFPGAIVTRGPDWEDGDKDGTSRCLHML